VAYRGWSFTFSSDFSNKPILTSLVAGHHWTPKQRQSIVGDYGFYTVKLNNPVYKPVYPDLSELNFSNMSDEELLNTQIKVKKEIDIPASILKTGVYYYSPTVIGSVYLWGEFVEYRLGYRAEFCYPKHLWLVSRNLSGFNLPQICDELSNSYGIPVEIHY